MTLRKKMRSKRGSAAVTLTCIFVSMVLVAGAVGEAASRKAAVAVVECTFEVSGRSVLAGYDRGLKDRYALFGYEYDEQEICEEIRRFSEDSLRSFPLTECTIADLSAEKAGYCLADPEIFQKQINEIMKYKVVTDRISEFTGFLNAVSDAVDLLSNQEEKRAELETEKEEIRKAQEETESKAKETSDKVDISAALRQRQQTSGGSAENTGGDAGGADFDTADSVHEMLKKLKEDAGQGTEEDTEEDRVLRNGRITETLPSVIAGVDKDSAFSGILSALTKFTEFTDMGNLKSEIYTNEYILEFFTEHTDTYRDDSFFRNEAEYILYGSNSDEENYKKAKRAIRTVRTGLNMAYIYSHPDMVRETLTLAESLTPGPFVPLTQLLIIAAWSSLESWNDMKNLESGNRIPLTKSQETWKISLSSVASGEFSDGMIVNDSEKGLSYASYLKLLLMTEKSETKLLRMMDLIQINMKGSQRRDFVLSNLFCGFILKAQLNKRSICPGVGSGETSVRMVHSY